MRPVATDPSKRPGDILVIDDDAATLDYFAFALETCGAVVTVAMGAREALQIITQVSPTSS